MIAPLFADITIFGVPTSFQAEQLITESAHIQLSTLAAHPDLTVGIDGADEIDDQLNLIKGGGGCALQEKVVASCVEHLVIIADHTKPSSVLGRRWRKGIPLEVLPIAYVAVQRKLQALGAASCKLRMATAKAGPVVTDHGGFILDADFGEVSDVAGLDAKLHGIPGLLETGLFVGMAKMAFIANADGTVDVLKPRPPTPASQ